MVVGKGSAALAVSCSASLQAGFVGKTRRCHSRKKCRLRRQVAEHLRKMPGRMDDLEWCRFRQSKRSLNEMDRRVAQSHFSSEQILRMQSDVWSGGAAGSAATRRKRKTRQGDGIPPELMCMHGIPGAWHLEEVQMILFHQLNKLGSPMKWKQGKLRLLPTREPRVRLVVRRKVISWCHQRFQIHHLCSECWQTRKRCW